MVVMYGDFTTKDYHDFCDMAEKIGVIEATWLCGYPYWLAGDNVYVFVGDGVSA